MAEKEKLVSLNRQRGGYKGQLTRIETFLLNPEKDFVECQAKLNSVKKIMEKLDDLKCKYFEVIIDDNDLQPHLEAFLEIEEQAEKIEVSIQKFLLSNRSDNNVIDQNSSSYKINNGSINVKLPDIPLPKFSGNYQDWYTFKDQFITLIDKNDNLNETQRLFYLKSSLKDIALDLVTSDDTYDSLFKALENRFQNKRAIVNSHMNEILCMEMSSQDVVKSLRTIVDKCLKHIRALKTIGLELNQFSEVMLINIILRKLDKESKKQFELSLESTELPSWKEFIDFLQKRCLVLENLQNSCNLNVKPKHLMSDKNAKFKNFLVKNTSHNLNACVLCGLNHPIYKCDSFLKQNEYGRYSTAKKFNLCLNCLSLKHKIAQCLSKTTCQICSKKHNTLLHRNSETDDQTISLAVAPTQIKEKEINSLHEINKTNKGESEIEKSLCSGVWSPVSKDKKVLLSTCIVYLENVQGIKIPFRAMLDCGSESCLGTKRLADLLQIKKNKTNVCISGITGNITNLKTKVQTFISNKDGSFRRPIELLITQKITERVPSCNINLQNLKIPKHIKLADPEFGKPAKIDILIGAEIFYEILEADKQKISQLTLQKTVFGYVVSGTVQNKCHETFCGLIQKSDPLEENLQKFWKLESVENESRLISVEDQFSENHFLETYYRDDTGRFVVSMPLKESPLVLGESRGVAEKRLNQLWNRLERNSLMRELYCDFMKQYENLNHMSKVTENIEESGSYYLPHHGVYRPENPSTILRVVFDGSSPTTSGKSLNDILFKGLVSEELYDIMIRFRKHRYVILADIEKMYRQIVINPKQRKLLRILWKKDAKSPIDVYELNTVTYGTSCAPFLAVRVLKQLAIEASENFSKASEVLLNDCYMDDIITGEDSLDAVKELQSQLIQLLDSAGMHLHKWKANNPILLKEVCKEKLDDYSFLENETKALGVTWIPNQDVFTFRVKISQQEKPSKRTILSDIARLFDPIGLIGPVLTKAKTYMQELWKLKLDWDDPIPNSLFHSWIQFTESLNSLENLKINRYMLTPCAQQINLFGFADASTVAFGAAVYIQSSYLSQTSCNLISSKSQIAPLKTVSIPRLELSACLLLSKLVTRILKALKLVINDVYLYTDSQIALAWINTPPWKLKTFVGNRVAKIQEYTQNFHWNYVSSSENPADLISRGLDATELINNQLWWHGPSDFISQETSFMQDKELHLSSNERDFVLKEMKDDSLDLQSKETVDCNIHKLSFLNINPLSNDFFNNLFSITNDYLKLIRICSFLFRFIRNSRNPENRSSGPLSVLEIKNAEIILVKQVQYESFSDEIKRLQKQKPLTGKSRLKYFNPFFDVDGLVRIGGRLENSSLAFDRKHPILLPHKHKLSEMIFDYFHRKFFHVGPQALLHHVRAKFWILNGRSLARKVVHKCIICFRNKPVAASQIMGNLPPSRVNPSPPFQTCGIDFCGPFQIKYKNQRKGKTNKIYVALFICFATKAIHLEIVTDLKTESFIATLKRFFARRGKSSTIITDNGTTFVGTNTELKKLHAMANSPNYELANYLASESINWKFIPARSPNFGGLWEAGVKAFKHHLKRTLGNSHVTLEEFLTIITQIEGVLNSRPLQPLSSDPNDIEILTPGHFLIGRPIISLPEPDITQIKENRLSSWQKITKFTQIIWKKWQRDYLNHLQQRNKWLFEKENIKEGCMVILKDDNLPPCRWALGRIIGITYGADGKVRVLKIKTMTGTVTRGISKVCPLPMDT